MKNSYIFLILLLTIFSSCISFAQDLKPFINFLRQTPGHINGTVYFDTDSVLFDDGWTQVKLLKNQPVEFTFKEGYLSVRPRPAFLVKSYKLRVYVDEVTWTPDTGIKSKSHAPADFTGLSSSYVSGQVAEALKTLFEARLKRANAQLRRIRIQNSVGNVFSIAKTIVGIFTESYGEGASGFTIPKYRGEIGLNFLPSTATAFNLYGMRVGVKQYDHYRSGFSFIGDTNGIYPYALEMTSRDGVDVNYGKEFKIAMRLILESVKINSSGTGLKLDLGASSLLRDIITVAELAASTQSPGAKCEGCVEMTKFPSVRVRIEKQVREAIVTQVKELWPMIQGLNISPRIYSAFNRREGCRITGLTCIINCSSRTNGEGDRASCKSSCQQKMNICLK